MSWEQDAAEYGRHVKAGGWRLGLLVARNVEKGNGKTVGLRNVATIVTTTGKVSAKDFASEAGTSGNRVLRHLTAWEKAAKAGLVPKAEDLEPGQEIDLEETALGDWGDWYDASASNGMRANKATTAVRVIDNQGAAAVVEAMPPEMRQAVVEAIALEAPDALTAAMDASPEVDLAVSVAQNRTAASKEMTRTVTRTGKEHQARVADTPTVIRPADVLAPMWAVDEMVEKIKASERTDHTLYIGRHTANWLRHAQVEVEAWVEGVTVPLSDEDFQKKIEAFNTE